MERKILDLFTFNEELKFNEIEKLIRIRSNKLAYHLKQLIQKKTLIKKGEYYQLSEDSEYLIPYLSEKSPVLPIVLIHIGNQKEAFLYKRQKRPYKNKLSLPGGRLLIGESIFNASKRIMKTKHGFEVIPKRINSISLEQVKKKKKILHFFLLILVKVETKEKIDLININQNKLEIIESDYKLIKSNPKEIDIKTIYSKI
jgi:ADP-ribose pyrophosphatase YjhB (NUDIX family)